MTNTPEQQQVTTYPVNIEYISGSGPTAAILGQRILITSDINAPNNDVTVIFDPPVSLTIESNPFFDLKDMPNVLFLVTEYPLGTVTRRLISPQYTQPIDLAANEPVAKLYISEGFKVSEYQVDILLNNFALNPVDMPTYDPNDALSIQRQQEVNSERLVDAVNNLATTVQRQGEIASENLNAAILQSGLNVADTASQLANNATHNTQDFASSLADSLTTNFGLFTDTLSKAIGGATGLPTNVIDEVIAAIRTLINETIQLVVTGINDGLRINQMPVLPALTKGGETLNNALNNQAQVIQNLLHGQYKTLDAFYNALNASGANTGLLKTLQDTITVISTISLFIKARMISAEVTLNQLTLSNDTPNLNDINTIVLAYFRGNVDYEQATQELAKYGLNQERVNQLFTSRALLVGLSDIKTALQRGLIDDTQHDTLLAQYGISPGNIELLKAVYPLLPSPNDITRMADKHIFATDIPQIFGQNSELDQGYIDGMKMWGIAEDWVRKLWAGHWSLPGLQETFDMWHRGAINDEQLDVFFKLTDILPFFREKLKLLSFNLVTRVDIRRLYHVGVYTQQDVYEAYVKEGYSPTDADKLTQFTVINDRLSETPKDVKIRGLTESLVVKAFKKGIISEQDAINRLAKVGYLAGDASLILQLETQTDKIQKVVDKTQYYHDKTVNLVLQNYAKGVFSRSDAKNYLTAIGVPGPEADQELYYADLERITELKSLVINHVRTAYTKGQIDKAQSTNLMLTYGFGMSEIQLLFEELDIIKSLRNKELTLPQLTAIAKKQIITPEQFAQELANMGYNDTHISWIVTETFGA